VAVEGPNGLFGQAVAQVALIKEVSLSPQALFKPAFWRVFFVLRLFFACTFRWWKI
jgi:hypothetical protein